MVEFDFLVKIYLQLFDKIVLPVLLYGCEVCGYENLHMIEHIHLKFFRHIFRPKCSILFLNGLWRNWSFPFLKLCMYNNGFTETKL